MRSAKNSTEVLKAALWMLENVGWCKNQSVRRSKKTDKITGFCATGAISYVEAEAPDARYRARRRLDLLVPKKNNNNVVHLNDDKKTTKEDILKLFRRAIKKGAK